MATKLQILCITKSNRMDAHERITNIGGKNTNGTPWRLSQTDAIAGIENGTYDFHVTQGGRTVNVIVSKSRYGHKYIKTVADGEQPDNLLSLSQCS